MYYAFIDESESPHDSVEPERFGYGVYYIGSLLAVSNRHLTLPTIAKV